jgi:hypothetical protein
MYPLDAKDTDALGRNAAVAQASAIQEGPVSDQTVWDQLKTEYDPEIPGNISPTRITKPMELRFALAYAAGRSGLGRA